MVDRTHTPSPLYRQLLEIGVQYSRFMQQLLALLRPFDDSGEWALHGYRTCAHWLSAKYGIDVATGREWVRIAQKLGELPTIAASFDDGKLSYSKVRLLTRYANPETERDLDQIGRETDMAVLDQAIATYLRKHETEEEEEERHKASTYLRWRAEPDGMTAFYGRLAPEKAAALIAAVDQQVERTQSEKRASMDASSPRKVVTWPSLAQQRAVALVDRVTTGEGGVAAECVFHIRGDGCTMDDGTPISDHVVARLLPDSFVRVLIHDAEARPINASGRRRLPSNRQKRVVKERDRRCVDCGSTDLLRYDHNPPFEKTRQTVIDELELRCSPCHKKKHDREQKDS